MPVTPRRSSLPAFVSRIGLPLCSLALLAGGYLALARDTEVKEPSAPAPVAQVEADRAPATVALDAIASYPASTAVVMQTAGASERPATIQLCQLALLCDTVPCETVPCETGTCGTENPIRMGVDCAAQCGPCPPKWNDWQPIPWQVFAHGEYVGPARTQHVPEYRLRVDDQLDFIYRLTRNETSEPYQLNVGDQIRVESLTDANLDRDLVIQPDGSITLRLLGQVRAARRTVEELRASLEEQYQKYYKTPAVTVTPLQVNTRLEDLRATVDGRFGSGGQTRSARVTPEGTIQLPGIGSIPAQGLSLSELEREINARYADLVGGIEVTSVLTLRAPRHVFVLGEVRQPGRFTLEGPTTVMQAISMAGGWNFGGDLKHVVVFRRAEDWRLIATKLDLHGALLGKQPCPADEIFLRDSDLVMLPKSSVLLTTDFIDLIFVRGIYGMVPNQGMSISFTGDGVF
jgi:polysaccharide biosynthesis/export protein